nr:fatty acid desaturase family protein [Tanacetum cinerariifolium]
SPFLDSDSDEEEIKETYETIVDKQKERRESAEMRIKSNSRRKQISSQKGKSQERTNKFPNIIRIDKDEDKNENDRKDVSSLKRKWSSINVKVEDDSDEERCRSILRRKPVSKELQSDCKVKVEEAYMPVIEKHTERWETEAEMIIEFSQIIKLVEVPD